MVSFFCAIEVSSSRFPRFIRTAEPSRNPGSFCSVTPLLEPAIPAHSGQHSEPIRTPFRISSDSNPKQLGHHSDGVLKLSGFLRNTVRIQSEQCPACIGTPSGFTSERRPRCVGIRTSSRATGKSLIKTKRLSSKITDTPTAEFTVKSPKEAVLRW